MGWRRGRPKIFMSLLGFRKREENLHSNLPGAFILAARNPSLLFLPKAKPAGPRIVGVVVVFRFLVWWSILLVP